MLEITVPALEQWDAVRNEFVYSKEQTLKLEHSLVSVSKWEAKWCTPFLSDRQKTIDETIDYIRCMTITQNVDPDVYARLTRKNINDVNAYIESKQTATWINKNAHKAGGGSRGKQITSELIYYWMIQLGIPFECQKWHLNRLLMLVEVCQAEGDSGRKMSRNEIMSQNRALNEARRRQLHTKG